MQIRPYSIALRVGCVDHQYSQRQVKQATAIPGQGASIHFMHDFSCNAAQLLIEVTESQFMDVRTSHLW